MTCEHEWEMEDQCGMTAVKVVYCTTTKTATVTGGESVLFCPLCGAYATVPVHYEGTPEVLKEGSA